MMQGRPQHIRTVRTCVPFSPQQSYTNTAIPLNYSDCVQCLHMMQGRPQHIRTVRTCVPFSPQQSYTNTAIPLNYSDCVRTSVL